MTKLYYTDPFSASYMAKEFLVRMLGDDGEEILWARIDNTIEWLVCDKQSDDNYPGYVGERFYIHPDSLHIFEPQVGDVVAWKVNEGKPYEEEFINRAYKELIDYKIPTHIIQRDGKPFFMPESEEA